MSEIVTFTQKREELDKLLTHYAPRIESLLPAGLSAQRLITTVQNACQRNPRLLDCPPGTIVGCVVQAAELGLEFGARQHAHLIPRKIKGQQRCTLLIDYRGLAYLALQGGGVRAIWAHAVYEGDHFDHQLGDSPSLVHRPALDRPEGAEVLAAYAVAELANGRKLIEVVPRRELEKVRDSASGSTDRNGNPIGPWASWFSRMARKTAMRRVCNLLAATGTGELAQAVQVDTAGELGRQGDTAARVEAEIARVYAPAPVGAQEAFPSDDPDPQEDEARTGDSEASGAKAAEEAQEAPKDDGKDPWWAGKPRKGSKLWLAIDCRRMVLVLQEGDPTAKLVQHLGESFAACHVNDLPSLDMATLKKLHAGLSGELEQVEREDDQLPDGGAS